MSDDSELPIDYEPCGECGHDHAYEPEEAMAFHCTWDDGEEPELDIEP
jgi:hypothetical protein